MAEGCVVLGVDGSGRIFGFTVYNLLERFLLYDNLDDRERESLKNQIQTLLEGLDNIF